MSEFKAQLVVQVQANAKRDQIVSFIDRTAKIKVAAPPVEGKANRKLIIFLSRILGISKGNITIQKGTKSKMKVLEFDGISQSQLEQLLADILNANPSEP